MSNLYPFAKLLWSLTGSGAGTTLSAAGNSGTWSGNEPGDLYPATANETAVDLRDSTDIALMVTVGAVTSSPTLVVSVNVFDDLGNSYATGLTTASITAAGGSVVAGGLHGASTAYLVLPRWAQVAWTCSGGSVTGCEIALFGR